MRRDLVPFLLAFAALLLTALPAFWYEAQVAWIRGSEEIVEPKEESDIIAFDMEDEVDQGGLLDSDSDSPLVAAASAPLSAIDLLVQEVYTPDNVHFYAMYGIPLFMFLSGIMWLALYWSVKFQVLLQYRNEGDITAAASGRASHVRVIPVEHGGKSEICLIQRAQIASSSSSSSSSSSGVEIFFMFQKTKYLLHQTGAATEPGHVNAWFAPVEFPTHDPLQSYLTRARTAGSESATTDLVRQYGENVFDIPLPPFMDLFKEHALAPFFVFQIFCVLLWCLDEYWYYSLVTLFMLVMFECMLVQRRLKSLEFLREMRMKPYPVQVYRQGKWTAVPTAALVPHDVVSIVRPSNEHHVVPADVLLLTGSVVVNEAMLTGESVPQVKECIEASADDLTAPLEINKTHKRNMLFGGTKVLLANSPTDAAAGSEAVASSLDIKSPPDGGCIGYVVRTGFNTSQGKLVRTILFSSESVNINNTESLLFIGVLLVFAIAASAYVCLKGLEDASRSRYKLMLNCIMIVTSVVPPELPMELSLAVNTSLLALMRQNVFCTEPFRIPLAGAVDIAAFDKTGTVTSDDFIVKGVAGIQKKEEQSPRNDNESAEGTDSNLVSVHTDLPLSTKLVIAGCHSLTFLPDTGSKDSSSSGPKDHIIGDPLEKSAIAFIEWSVGRQETASSKVGRERLRLLHKYPFSSALKRMSAIIALEHESGAPLRVVTKGAAEVMETMFDPATLPADYAQLHGSYALQGCRVLALGWKDLSDLRDLPDDRRRLKGLHRDEIESGLTFAGFLVLQCPLKKDSLEVITHLKQSSHQVMMISGDAPLTCCFVAMQLGITTRPTVILTLAEEGESSSSDASSNPLARLMWRKNTLSNDPPLPFSLETKEAALRSLTRQYDLCISGSALEYLTHHVQESSKSRGEKATSAAAIAPLAMLVAHTKVFARTSPDQKELILHWLKGRGLTTLMCGDGTNDVGALKQAHIGVALISEEAAQAMDKLAAERAAARKAGRLVGPNAAGKQTQVQKAKPSATPAAAGTQKTKLQQQLAEQMAKMEEEMADESTTPRLGDASVASPFTSKLPFISSCVEIIRQGRCTLVTTLQMFHILGINCLISAYSMSVLYLDGVKWGDTQMTISSLSVAMFFFCISRAQPLKRLSAERPPKRLFTVSMILSVLGQFAIHMAVLLTAIQSAQPHTPQTEEHISPHKTFKPNVLNTVVYLVSTTQTAATFAANYRGRPFMEGLTENSALYKSLMATFGLMVLLASELMPSLNAFLELHPLPDDSFRNDLILMLVLDVVVTWAYSNLLRKVFAIKPTAEQMQEVGLATSKAAALAKKAQ